MVQYCQGFRFGLNKHITTGCCHDITPMIMSRHKSYKFDLEKNKGKRGERGGVRNWISNLFFEP